MGVLSMAGEGSSQNPEALVYEAEQFTKQVDKLNQTAGLFGDEMAGFLKLQNRDMSILSTDRFKNPLNTEGLATANALLEEQKNIRKANREQTSVLQRENLNPQVQAAFKAAGERNLDSEIAKFLK